MSSSKSASTTATTTNVANQQVGASEGATAIGAGANVTVTTLDAQLGQAAIAEVGDVSKEGFKVVADTAKAAIDSGIVNVDSSFGFVSKVIEQQNAREQANLNFTRQQSELIAAQAGVVPPASFDTLADKITLVGGLVVAAGVVLFIVSRRKAA